MSKPALGRGLGSLLHSAPPAADPVPPTAAPAGVHLLLQGREETPATTAATANRGWLPLLLVGADVVLLAAGALLLFSEHPLARVIAGALLVLVGGVLSLTALALWSRPGLAARTRSAPTPPPAATSSGAPLGTPARVRVHFVDELPRSRNTGSRPTK